MPKLEQMVEDLQLKHLKKIAKAGAGSKWLGSGDRANSPMQQKRDQPPALNGGSFEDDWHEEDTGTIHPDFR